MNKISLFLTAAIAVGLSACATNTVPANIEQYIADDVVNRISADYPVANTTLSINEDNHIAIVVTEKLRNRGFAVTHKDTETQAAHLSVISSSVSQNLYRVTYTIQGKQYAKAYQQDESGNIVGGAWTKR